jgi:hypothetical protein
MIQIEQLVNTGLAAAFVVCVFMALWTVTRNYVVHIFPAARPTRGMGRAIAASLPAAGLALVVSNIPAWLIWQHDPVFASQVQTYAMWHVLLGIVMAFAFFCFAGAVHAGLRQHFANDAEPALDVDR